MEYQVLAEFVRILKSSENSKIEASLLQYLSIMIQNMDNEQAIFCKMVNLYWCLWLSSLTSKSYLFIHKLSIQVLPKIGISYLHVADYCFSNGYINNIISHTYKFVGGDLASYYVSFLRFWFFLPLIICWKSFLLIDRDMQL
jgi:protein CLEC16A